MTSASPYASVLAALAPQRSSIIVGGISTAYWEYPYSGPEVGAEPRTLVLVHGFRGDHHGLEAIAAYLSDYRVVIPDLPGFGESEPPDAGADIDAYASWLGDFVTAIALRADDLVVGHSFGSIVVSAAAARSLLPVEQLVLINPIGQNALQGPRGVLTRLAVFYYWLGKALPEKAGYGLLTNGVIVRVMSKTMAKTKDPELLRWIHGQHDSYFSAFSDRSSVLEAFNASVSHDVAEYAARIPTRTLLIAADRDDITPIEAQRRLVTEFPHASLVEIEGVGHLVHYEAPELAAQRIREFFPPSP